MDQEQARIQDDLRGLIEGDVRCDDVFVQLYASDGSIYEIRPLGIVRPRSTQDVAACAQYATENRIPLHARGAGTGLAGESLGRGLILDFSKYMRRIIHTDSKTVRIQPGVVHAQLNEHLRGINRVFGPDPATSQVTTMGSVIAIDASGSRWLQYGSARQHVQSLQIVLADGTVLEVGRESLDPTDLAAMPPKRRELIERLADVLFSQDELIQRRQPRSQLNRSGYQLNDVLERDPFGARPIVGGHLDLAKLISGSEGTLALITEATLAIQPLPASLGMAMLFFDRLESASLAVKEILPYGPAACDLLDRRHLALARETDPQFASLIPPDAEALLLVELSGADSVDVRRRLGDLVDHVKRRKRLAFEARQAFQREEMEQFWQLARRVTPTLHRLKGTSRPLPFVEDLAVPPAKLTEFLVTMQNTLKRHQVTASLYGHVGHGQLHVRPFMDLGSAEDVQKMNALAADLCREVIEIGGAISGEHGDGLSRTPFIRQQYGELYNVFRDIKWIFDPLAILNPGKIVTDEPELVTRDLRLVNAPDLAAGGAVAPEAPSEIVKLQLDWSVAELAHTARSCNGCGACRTQAKDLRMCPVFRAVPTEEASPRAKANLIRGILTGQLEPSTLASEDFKAVTDLCVNCHMCRLECPAGVDIPRLMVEGKGNYVATNGLKPTDWLMSRVDLLSAWGSLVSPLANWALSNRQARWVMEKTLGIAHGRKLPRFAPRTFMRRAARRRLTRPTRRSGRKVLFFVDTYAMYHDPQLADALVAVLEHNGVAVYVHPDQQPSGMAMISLGALDSARKLAAKNLILLAEAVRQGYHIVATEPSAALCLTHEYRNLINDDDARLVAENSSEACAYLWKLHESGKLRLDLKPVNFSLGYHLPCHLKALGVGTPGESLLRLIPSLRVNRIEKGCSGMAGTYGLKREHYRNSLRAGWGLISSLREPGLDAGATECSTCKIQMEQGTSKPTIHPLKLLALAYGLMPELSSLLTARSEELTIT